MKYVLIFVSIVLLLKILIAFFKKNWCSLLVMLFYFHFSFLTQRLKLIALHFGWSVWWLLMATLEEICFFYAIHFCRFLKADALQPSSKHFERKRFQMKNIREGGIMWKRGKNITFILSVFQLRLTCKEGVNDSTLCTYFPIGWCYSPFYLIRWFFLITVKWV